ncbi:hypothetical protein TCAL_15415, partial [Tigriopus californicus]
MEASQVCFESNEMDRSFVTRRSSSNQRLFICAQTTKDNIKDKRLKTNASRKTHDCPAKLFFKEASFCRCVSPVAGEKCELNRPSVQIRGCLQHSHPLERRNLRLSKAVKEDVVKLLEAGLTPNVIINKYHPAEKEDPASKPVTTGDVYSL